MSRYVGFLPIYRPERRSLGSCPKGTSTRTHGSGANSQFRIVLVNSQTSGCLAMLAVSCWGKSAEILVPGDSTSPMSAIASATIRLP